MSNGEVLSREDRISEARRILEELGEPRGDSFDIGRNVANFEGQDTISQYMSNPKQLSQLFSLTGRQAENVQSLLVGAGTGGIYKLLNRHLGPDISGAIGGLVSAYITRKIVGK